MRRSHPIYHGKARADQFTIGRIIIAFNRLSIPPFKGFPDFQMLSGERLDGNRDQAQPDEGFPAIPGCHCPLARLIALNGRKHGEQRMCLGQRAVRVHHGGQFGDRVLPMGYPVIWLQGG